MQAFFHSDTNSAEFSSFNPKLSFSTHCGMWRVVDAGLFYFDTIAALSLQFILHCMLIPSQDVASFLGVDAGLFYFDASYRPVPLEMQFVGVSERNILQAKNIMDDVCYEKVSFSNILQSEHSSGPSPCMDEKSARRHMQ